MKCSSTLLALVALFALPLPGYGQINHHIYGDEAIEPVAPTARAAVRERLAGPDRYGTAIAVTTKRFTDHAVDKVYIASGENFPDAISVTSLIAQTMDTDPKSAVLLSPTAGLTPEVLGEVQRIIKPEGDVVLIGGDQAVSPAIAEQITKLVPKTSVSRIAGPTRVETAIEIGKAVHANGPINEVIITPSDDYRIAIVASALTAKHQAVQLNSPPTADGKLHPSVQAWIDAVKPTRISVVGRTDFLTGWSQPNVKRITDAQSPERIAPGCPPGLACLQESQLQPAGPDQVIAEHLLADEFADSAHHILVARERAVDGIAASQFAAQQKAAILPVSTTPSESQRYAQILREKGKRAQITFWAIGGEQAISEDTYKGIAEAFTR